MKYVLDASVALKWVLPEPDSANAKRIRADFQNKSLELLAPDVFFAEIGHALARAERRKIIFPPLGSLFLGDILSTSPTLHDSAPILIVDAFQIASQMQIGVYDCLYIALAEREQCQFVTADDKIVRNLQAAYPFITSLSSLP